MPGENKASKSLEEIVGNESAENSSRPARLPYSRLGLSAGIGLALGGMNALFSGLAFSLGSYAVDRFKKKKKAPLRNYSFDFSVGSAMGGMGSSIYRAINRAVEGASLEAFLGRAALAVGPGNWAFTFLYHVTDSIVKRGTRLYQSLWKRLSRNYISDVKETTKWLGVPLALTVNGYLGGYPGIIAADSAYRYVVG